MCNVIHTHQYTHYFKRSYILTILAPVFRQKLLYLHLVHLDEMVVANAALFPPLVNDMLLTEKKNCLS